MPELNKGFIPFSYVDSARKYDDEVGNDYNPHGWNTASAMYLTSGTVTASGEEITIIKPAVDEKVNWAGFEKGVWNKIETGDDGGYTKPEIKSITINIPDTIDKDNTTIKDFTITTNIEDGSDPLSSITYEIIINDTAIVTQTVTDPSAGTLEFNVSDDIMKQILDSGATYFINRITVKDDKKEIVSEKTISIVHQVLFGVVNTPLINFAPEIIETITDKEKIQKRTISYSTKVFTLTPFLPTGDWAYMFIAIPSDFGKLIKITDGAVTYEIGGDEWKTSTCKIKNIDYNLYVLQYNNEGTFEFIVTVN